MIEDKGAIKGNFFGLMKLFYQDCGGSYMIPYIFQNP